MPSNGEEGGSRLPVILKDVEKNYNKPEKRNDFVPEEKYNAVDDAASNLVKLGTNGVAYVSEGAISGLFQLSKAKAAYVYENQIPDADKRSFGEQSYAHSAAVVGLLDKKAQEVRNSDTQALLQYARDSLINISDSSQAQDLRRKCDTLTTRELPKLRKARGATHDEVTGEPARPGFAFHHANPKEIHTDPEDALNPSKGRNLNVDTHHDVHKNGIYDESQFDEYKEKRNV